MPIIGGNKQLEAAGLDLLGTNDAGDALPTDNVQATLLRMAESVISKAQANLNRSGAEATGELEKSLHFEDVKFEGTKMYVDVLVLERYKFTDQGVNGVEKSHGSPYSFKTKYANKKMATELLKWMRVRGRRAMKYKAISKTERKDKSIKRKTAKSDDLKSLAYATAVSIKKKGIKPTKFFTKAVKSTEKEFKKELAAGFKLDIINAFK
jgi:hypothetical protein